MLYELLSFIKKIVYIAVTLAISLFIGSFIIKNQHTVDVFIYFLKHHDGSLKSFSLPVWFYSLCIFTIGLLCGLLLMWFSTSRWRTIFHQSQIRNNKLKKDLSRLKDNISKTVS